MTVLGTLPINTDLSSSHISNFTEAVDDQLTTMLVAGSGTTITHNEGANTFTIASTGGGGGGTITAVTDTGTMDLTISGTTLSADLKTTSTPQVASVGVGRAAMSSTCLALQCSTITEKVVDDTAHGSDLQHFGITSPGLRHDIRHGTTGGTMVTTNGSTLKVNRVQNITSTIEGAEFIHYSAIVGINNAPSTSKAQPVGVSGIAFSASTVSPPGSTNNPDACGLIGHGSTSGTGVGMGAHFEGHTSSTSGAAKAIEVQTRNASGVDGVFSASGLSNMSGVWAVLNNRLGGGCLEFGNPFGFKWDWGISAKSANTGPFNTTTGGFIRDESQGAYSLFVSGTHAVAAIAVAAATGSNKVLIGVTSSAGAHKMLVKSDGDSTTTLELRPNSGSATFPLLLFSDSAAGALWSVGPTGHITIGASAGIKIGTAISQKLGFFNATPVVQQTLAAVATDAATTQTLANSLRTLAINLGLGA